MTPDYLEALEAIDRVIADQRIKRDSIPADIEKLNVAKGVIRRLGQTP